MNDIILAALAGSALTALLFLWARSRSAHAITARPLAPTIKRGDAGLLPGQARQILDQMSEGVLVVDAAQRPSFANPAARQLLGFRPGDLPARLPSTDVVEVARSAVERGEPVEELVDVFFPARLSLRVQATPQGEEGAVIVIQDVTDELRAQQVRREFVAHASHELKSPVAGLGVLGEALNEALVAEDVDAANRFSSKMLRELTRLSKLVNDLLDLSRIEDTATAPEELCDLALVIRKELAQLEATAHSAGVVMSQDVAKELWLRGDARQLALLVRNLAQNAIQYTPSGGYVEIDAKTVGHSAILRVSDNGIGIPMESQARIFERFYRVDRARSRDRGGTGLGLAIVKHVTELHGGSIEVHSELGAGSTFTVRFPEATPNETRLDTGSSAPARAHNEDKETA